MNPAPAGYELVAHICILPTKDAGPTKFFTSPSDPRGFPVYRAALAATPLPPSLPVAQQAEPLTLEQIGNIEWGAGCVGLDWGTRVAAVRAVERFYNISAAPAGEGETR